MPFEIKTTRRVEFVETDMAGIVHYSNFFRYMEATETAFFRSLGLSLWMKNEKMPVGWPRVHAECDYRQPLRFEDEVEIHMVVREKRARSLTLEFRFRKMNATPPVEVARGKLVVVCVSKDAHGKMSACPFPDYVSEKIEAAPPDFAV